MRVRYDNVFLLKNEYQVYISFPVLENETAITNVQNYLPKVTHPKQNKAILK